MSRSELYRPQFHFAPPAMWTNDPNGLVYYQGEYHVFYQYHPESTVWGSMHWRHAVSRDLINWEHLPIALYPDENGMIFFGSAVVDWNNTAGFGKEALIAIFTYNTEYFETQNLAHSTNNGRTWTKYAGNPVIPYPEHLHNFRDPKVFWHADHWVMSLAAGDTILFYTSSDLKHWELSGSFGGGYGSIDGVWKTPDLFQLAVDNGSEIRWVLTVRVGNGHPAGGSGTQYFIGDFDGKNFTSENPIDTVLWADLGADYYAPQSWSDEPNHRRLVIGWMSNWQYEEDIPTISWRGVFNLIREASLRCAPQGIRLIRQPIPELNNLRNKTQHWENERLILGINLLADLHCDVFEINVEFQVTDSINRVGFHVGVGEDDYMTSNHCINEQKHFVDRTHSGQSTFHADFAKIHFAELACTDNILRLQIFVDHLSVELFADDGLVVIADCIFLSTESTGIELFVEGDPARLNSLDIHQLTPAVFTSKTVEQSQFISMLFEKRLCKTQFN